VASGKGFSFVSADEMRAVFGSHINWPKEVLGRHPDASSRTFADTKTLRHRHRAGDGDERQGDGDASTRAPHE